MIRLKNDNEITVPTFEELLPKMQFKFRRTARKASNHDREEVYQELVALALKGYTLLIEKEKYQSIFASPIANYAIRHYWSGRRITGQNSTDIFAARTKVLGRAETMNYVLGDENVNRWTEIVLSDDTDVSRDVAFKIDYENWFATLPLRDQRMLEAMVAGDTTNEIAGKFNLSPATISQKRRRFVELWKEYRKEKDDESDLDRYA